MKRETFRALERRRRRATASSRRTRRRCRSRRSAAACERPERVLGVHFFNPAPVMPLVEIVPGARAPSRRRRRTTRARSSTRGARSTVLAADTPGFIVNRIARPFYGEALRLLEEGDGRRRRRSTGRCASCGGFRMGPFELMDFIGHDVNYAVTRVGVRRRCSTTRATGPSLTQQRLVEAGLLGRKSGRGFYDYARRRRAPEPTRRRALGDRIVGRVVAMLVNEAVDAVYLRVASPADIELAMTQGVNYPRGLLAWGDAIGPADDARASSSALQQETARTAIGRARSCGAACATGEAAARHERVPDDAGRSPSASCTAMLAARRVQPLARASRCVDVAPRHAHLPHDGARRHGERLRRLRTVASSSRSPTARFAFACNTHGRVTRERRELHHVSRGGAPRRRADRASPTKRPRPAGSASTASTVAQPARRGRRRASAGRCTKHQRPLTFPTA